jgi:hypothetical protein
MVTFVSREIVDYLSSDADVLADSRLLKSCVESFCSTRCDVLPPCEKLKGSCTPGVQKRGTCCTPSTENPADGVRAHGAAAAQHDSSRWPAGSAVVRQFGTEKTFLA